MNSRGAVKSYRSTLLGSRWTSSDDTAAREAETRDVDQVADLRHDVIAQSSQTPGEVTVAGVEDERVVVVRVLRRD
jgi:hypothetical protein